MLKAILNSTWTSLRLSVWSHEYASRYQYLSPFPAEGRRCCLALSETFSPFLMLGAANAVNGAGWACPAQSLSVHAVCTARVFLDPTRAGSPRSFANLPTTGSERVAVSAEEIWLLTLITLPGTDGTQRYLGAAAHC